VTRRLDDAMELRWRYAAMLSDEGIAEPRLKLVPLFRIGARSSDRARYAAGRRRSRCCTEALTRTGGSAGAAAR